MERVIQAVTLEESCLQIGARFDIDGALLFAYANEDTIGGHHTIPELQGWPGAKGIWGVEGQIIYALVRYTLPDLVLEVGNMWGTSTRHLAMAIEQNQHGELWTMDIHEYEWERITTPAVNYITADLFTFDYATDPPINFLFEDSFHRSDMCEHVWREFKQQAAPGAFIVSHDAGHFRVGPPVREGIERVVPYGDYIVCLTEPAACGLAIWRKP